jgi:MFS family permease
VGGWLIDHLISRGYDETPVRKTVLVVGMLLGLAVFGATSTTNPLWAIFWISIALSGLAAAAPVGWSIPSLIAPRGGTATIGGIMNFLNNMMGVVAPIATGFIVGATHSFTGAFLTAGIVLIGGSTIGSSRPRDENVGNDADGRGQSASRMRSHTDRNRPQQTSSSAVSFTPISIRRCGGRAASTQNCSTQCAVYRAPVMPRSAIW